MVVKVSWQEHEREYTIGIQRLFELLELDVTDEKIKKAVRKLLEQNEMEQKQNVSKAHRASST
jgi:hypothetical protein